MWSVVSIELKRPIFETEDKRTAQRINKHSKTHKAILSSSLKTYLEKVSK